MLRLLSKVTGRPLQSPTIAALAAGYDAATAPWREAGYGVATEAVAAARQRACDGCDRFRAVNGHGRCEADVMTCVTTRPWLSAARCPEGRWPE